MSSELSMVLKIKCGGQREYPEFVSKYLERNCTNPTVSSDCRLFWKSPSREKCYTEILSLTIFLVGWLVGSPLPHSFCLLSAPLPFPANHWRCEKLGITQEGWKACDASKEILILHCWTEAHTFGTHLKMSGNLYYPWIWEGLPKKEWEREYS